MSGKCKNQQRSRINKAFEKIPRFDGTNPSYSFDWLEGRKDLQRRVAAQLWDQRVQDHPHTATRSYQSAHQRCGTKEPFQPQDRVTMIKCLSSATSEAR